MTDEREMRPQDGGAAGADAVAAGAAGVTPEDVETAAAHAGAARDPEDDPAAAQLDEMRAELQVLNERHLRLAAEFDNYRKRSDRERMEQHTRSQADLARRLLDVIDDLQRVAEVDVASTTTDALHEGVALVEKKLRRALESAGLEPIDPTGEFFNPESMEALMTVPAEHPEEDDVVAAVLQKGYRFGNVLIRPARVQVKKYEE